MSSLIDSSVVPDEQLYEYYQRSQMLPTHSGFDHATLNEYERVRTSLFRDKLHLPQRLFNGARLIEFGPDTGQNSLVFARWGALLTLVEPNSDAWPHIVEYFHRFNLNSQLSRLVKTDVQHFETDEVFDIVIAEQSLHIVKPDTWLEGLTRMVSPQGFLLFSYNEVSGLLLDLVHRAVYMRYRDLAEADAYLSARQLYQAKWDTIPHFRPFDAWVMDLLDLPFYRLALAYDAAEFCERMFHFGMELYSSWPVYQDVLNVYWGKTRLEDTKQLHRTIGFIERSCLSYSLGGKIFLGAASAAEVSEIRRTVNGLVGDFDRLIDSFDRSIVDAGRAKIEKLYGVVRGPHVVVDSESQRDRAAGLLRSLDQILAMIGEQDAERMRAFCGTDEMFLSSWGSPHQYTIYQWRDS